ncbi:MAG: hypothetical protein CSA36_06245 [Draconibacterium sp.]|nr:MAG: hypothetical protein CSA36_06245 [Draconibacterium sp.]
MKRKGYLLLFVVTIVAFWQVFFLQNGIKWDFVDAFLPSRYFFSESILNNQFPLWNPYILYGLPIFADLVSVFSPEYWIIGNMFGYSNVTLQYVYLGYVVIAGISFYYFLTYFNVQQKAGLSLAVAYMFSGLVTGNAQHLAFVVAYALVPFVVASYCKFLKLLNKESLIQLSVALFLAIYCGYPGYTIILGYLLLSIFIFSITGVWKNRKTVIKIFSYHLVLIVIVILFSTVLLVAYIQVAPFMERYGGLPLQLAQNHPFTIKSMLSFLLPEAVLADPVFHGTNPSMANAYFGIIGFVLFLFALTRKASQRIAYLFLIFGLLSLFTAFGDQFFVRKLLFRYLPLMDMFQYPALFRGFTIFGFLAFAGINIGRFPILLEKKKQLSGVVALVMVLIAALIVFALFKIGDLTHGNNIHEICSGAKRYKNTLLKGAIQLFLLSVFFISLWKSKKASTFTAIILVLFLTDAVVTTQLTIYSTVINKVSPLKFRNYLKGLPKGFPVPELMPIVNYSDRNAQNEFVWMNNNVFPKRVTFDGKISFKPDGYKLLSDQYPNLLETIKHNPLIYFSDDVRQNASIENFSSATVFLSEEDFKTTEGIVFRSSRDDKLIISDFSPVKIEIAATTVNNQLLIYQQNYFNGWKVFVDGKEAEMLVGNFTHMAVLVPEGTHKVTFKYTNRLIIAAFLVSYFVFISLLVVWAVLFTQRHPGLKRKLIAGVLAGCIVFILFSTINRFFYQKNKKGMAPLLIQNAAHWKGEYDDDISIFLSTQERGLIQQVKPDTAFFVDGVTNLGQLSRYLMKTNKGYFAFLWQGTSLAPETRELVLSFYPDVKSQKRGNNSGYLLLAADTSDAQYNISDNFENQGLTQWSSYPERIVKEVLSGNHALLYAAGEEWGPVFEIPVDSAMLKVKSLMVAADVFFEQEIAKTLLVVTTQRNGETQHYSVCEINNFADTVKAWRRFVFTENIKGKVQEGDVLKIYFWNTSKKPFMIDNLKLKYNFTPDQ